ncbi:hypothetical protein IHE44_0013659 [Lamprotornis superbus]|uniref:Uncharacterized protein n=1 Tax=Lamprotornis superbus TaxID=245042 RepID=A0A835NYQ5_9PASS|nr:hypothetical protein IHE44_0013659 [Lamprotornis superbus]
MERLETAFKVNTEELQKILATLTRNFTNIFLTKLRTKAQPLLKKILTKNWILATERPDSLALAVSQFSKHLQHMREPLGQELLHEVHKYVVKEYVTQVIKPRWKMNRETRQEVSRKMSLEASIIHNTLIDQRPGNKLLRRTSLKKYRKESEQGGYCSNISLGFSGSDADWLLPAIDHIASIIGEKKKDKIKAYVKELCQDYPDIRYMKQQMPELLGSIPKSTSLSCAWAKLFSFSLLVATHISEFVYTEITGTGYVSKLAFQLKSN